MTFQKDESNGTVTPVYHSADLSSQSISACRSSRLKVMSGAASANSRLASMAWREPAAHPSKNTDDSFNQMIIDDSFSEMITPIDLVN